MNKLPRLLASSALTLLAACSSAPADDSKATPAPVPEVKEPTTTTMEITAQWQANPDAAFGEIPAASSGDDGAIAYAESTGWTDQTFTETWIMLQRLDNTGAMQGPAIELGVLTVQRRFARDTRQ